MKKSELRQLIREEIKHILKESPNDIKYDEISWSYGRENREEGGWRFYINDSDYGVDKKTILKKYPNNQELKNFLSEIENLRENGLGGGFYISHNKLIFE